MNETINKIKSQLRKRYLKSTFNYGKTILNSEDTNYKIANMIKGNEPVMISRLGSVELECLVEGIKYGKWTNNTKKKMSRNAGFFPVNEKTLDEFTNLYLKNLNEVDLIGVWHNAGEDEICRKYCCNATISHLKDLEPYYHANPWSYELKNKKVLVIHPFEESIQNQYNKNRSKIFTNDKVLPDFELLTLKAVQTIASNTEGYANWFEALNSMCEKVDKIDFDIAIIGAGAYGLPLAAYIKSLGKKAVHLGGSTQILFGIKGARWEKHEFISTLFNENWVKAKESERPKSYTEVEKGCYW